MLLCLPMACACATGAGSRLRLALLALTCLLSYCCMAWPHPCIYGTWLHLSWLLAGMLSPRWIDVDMVRARNPIAATISILSSPTIGPPSAHLRLSARYWLGIRGERESRCNTPQPILTR